MQQYVSNYEVVRDIPPGDYHFTGNSVGNKRVLSYVFDNNAPVRSVLDIGFGVGDLGTILKSDPGIRHWEIDGIDGFQDVCCNAPLFQRRIYRNVWHGLAQELPQASLNAYDVICLFDVIEHLDVENSTRLLRALLEALGPHSRLVLSTPLWFWPQSQQHAGDLEEHLIAVPVRCLVGLAPLMFTVNSRYLVGTFVYGRQSLGRLGHFRPITDKTYGLESGRRELAALGLQADDVLYRVSA